MTRDIAEIIGQALGSRVERTIAVSGGDINEAFDVRLADGRTLFAKTNGSAPVAICGTLTGSHASREELRQAELACTHADMFPAEAKGLAWLAEAKALRTPRVVAALPQVLVLEKIEAAPRRADFDRLLGQGLAALHRFGAAGFGLDHDNFIGRLPQANTALPSWCEFYRARRLEPQLRQAVDRKLASTAMRRGFARLFGDLESLLGPPEPPARLHGDLWGGNLLVDESGGPCVIDPAVYAGHREMDLAMMRLFGGFGPGVFAAYEDAFPLADAHRSRVSLYQLYPLMVHVNLFGGSYVSGVEAALARTIRED